MSRNSYFFIYAVIVVAVITIAWYAGIYYQSDNWVGELLFNITLIQIIASTLRHFWKFREVSSDKYLAPDLEILREMEVSTGLYSGLFAVMFCILVPLSTFVMFSVNTIAGFAMLVFHCFNVSVFCYKHRRIRHHLLVSRLKGDGNE